MKVFVFRAFISADKDFDGKVDEGEFEGMISAAAAFPQKFGFEFWVGSGEVERKLEMENIFLCSKARTSSRQLMRMATVLCLLMNGELLLSCF